MWRRSLHTSLPILPLNAGAVVRRIVGLAQSLTKFPLSGRKVPEFEDESIRELIAYTYRIIYFVDQSEVTIAAVIHGRRSI
jgi:toxin ParE1/3/4